MNKEKQYKYQFHVHTQYSHDSDISLHSLYKKLKKHSIDGIAITDHNTIQGALKFKEMYGEELDVIIGEEIMTKNGEIIGLFLKSEIKAGLSVEDTINEIKQQDGIVYIPHPYDAKRYKTCVAENILIKNKNDIDLVEVFNGRCIDKMFNHKASEICNNINKVGICGSDSHSKFELGYNIVNVNNKLNRNNIILEISKADFSNLKININIHHITKFVRIKKLIMRGKYNEVLHIVSRGCKKRLSKVK